MSWALTLGRLYWARALLTPVLVGSVRRRRRRVVVFGVANRRARKERQRKERRATRCRWREVPRAATTIVGQRVFVRYIRALVWSRASKSVVSGASRETISIDESYQGAYILYCFARNTHMHTATAHPKPYIEPSGEHTSSASASEILWWLFGCCLAALRWLFVVLRVCMCVFFCCVFAMFDLWCIYWEDEAPAFVEFAGSHNLTCVRESMSVAVH